MQTNNNNDRRQENDSNTSPIPEKNTSKPMDSKQDVDKANDPKIDQDFPGYPHYPAKEDIMDKRTGEHRVDMDVENLPNSNNKTSVSQRFVTDQTNDNANAPMPVQPASEDEKSNLGTRRAPREGMETGGGRNAEIGTPQNADSDDLKRGTSGTNLEEEDLDFSRSTDADVTPEERMALENVGMNTRDDDNLRRAALDTTDFDGDQLNEDSFGEVLTSSDLDIPDETDETTTTALGQGDEENKYYSLGSDRHESQEEDPQSGPNRDNS